MRSFLNSLSHLGNRLPETILMIIILAIVMVLILIFLTNYAVKKAGKEAKPKPEPKKSKEKIIPEYRMPPIGGRLSQFLALKGIFRVGNTSLSFLRALAFLRDRLNGLTYKYQLPWYLMVGASGSGKSTLLEYGGMSLPVGMPDFGISDPHPSCRWWFYNRAVILDIHGSLVMEEHKTTAQERGWRAILSLLGRYRSKRPLDGIIVTIPVSELYGKECLSPENLNARAKFLSHKLLAAQHHLGLRLPVYVIVTKCDFLPGFQNFCHELPLAQHHNMLGWSVPYALHSAYASHWVDEAIHSICNDLNSVQLEMFTHGTADENKDGIFVFPNELLSIKSGLKLYLDHLFKSSAYEEALMLRGIYLSGDGGYTPAGVIVSEDSTQANEASETKEDLKLFSQPHPVNEDALQLGGASINQPLSRTSKARLFSPEESQYPSTSRKNIFFGRDIFEAKIFFESGLAYPIYSQLVSANRNINLAKAGMIVFVGMGTFGMFNAYDNFTKNREYLMPVLEKVNAILSQLPVNSSAQLPTSDALFELQAKSLLEMMNHIHRASFFSFFIPSSWFSPLHDQLNNSLKISYEQIILRTIYMDLLLKTRDTLNMKPGITAAGAPIKTTSMDTLLTPIQTAEFLQLKTYVDQLDQLVKNVAKYNRLREYSDSALLSDLIDYTFGMQLPAGFSVTYENFRKVLQEAPYPPIDLKPYYSVAQGTLHGLYMNFLGILFSPQDPMSLLGQLRSLTVAIGSGQRNQPINLDWVRTFVSGLSQSLPSLGSPGHNWIDGDFFDPGPEFSDLMGKIDSLPLFGSIILEQLAKQTSIVYHAFRQDLIEINRTLINPSTPSPTQQPFPSEGLFNLEKILSKLFAEPFMAKTNGEMFIAQVPENKVILWNQKLIEDAIQLIKRYDTFVQKELDAFPGQLRETFKQIAMQNLYQNVVSNIAKAQNFTDIPKNTQVGDAYEELLRTIIGDVKATVPSFIKLLETLRNNYTGNIFVQLQNLLGTLSIRLLEKVDALLVSYHPYTVRNNNFDWWDGKATVFFEGFNVKDLDELKSYLDQQRQLISHLAVEYAQPIMGLLNADTMQGFTGKRALTNRWKRILNQLSQYDKRRPENTVSALENFIENDTNNLTMSNCFDKLSLNSIKTNSGDFFMDRRIQLQRALMARCEITKRQDSIKNYEKLVEAFNTSFKDKFPFTSEPPVKDQAEADPNDLKEFFQLFHDFGNSPDKILDQVYQLGEDAKEPYTFLKSMEAVKEFFHTFLISKLPGDVPSFDFEIDFRVNKDHEIGGNMIIEWSISPSDTSTISNTDKKKVGRWTYGNPVTLTFRWPDSAETQPFIDDAQVFMSVDEQTVTYTYPGQWALLWLLRVQQTSGSDFTSMQDTNPYTLRFEIPNGPEEKTLVYNRVGLLKPPKGKKPGGPLTLPPFPTEAPALEQKILDTADKPVIVQGLVEPSPEIMSDIETRKQKEQKNPKKKVPTEEEAPAEEPAPAEKPKSSGQ